MKKFILILFIIPSFYIYSQEEFFRNQNGISLAGINGINLDDDRLNGIGLSFHFKRGLTTGLGIQNMGYETYPIIFIGQYLTTETSINQPKIYLGISYAKIEEINVGSFNLRIIKIFFRESKFPFSLNGYTSAQVGYEKSPMNFFEVVPVIGIGYIHSLFVNNRLYPFIGISYTVEPFEKYSMYSVVCGLNLKFGASSEKSE